MSNPKQKRIAILAYPNLCTFEFGCAVELFALPRPDIENWYKTDIVALENKKLKATGGFSVTSDIVYSSKSGFLRYDMVVIAGWSGIDVELPKNVKQSLIDFHSNGGMLISFCSGAFALANTGLLDNKVATTHWRYETRFKERFPLIHFQENVLYTEEDRIYTSAGSASALDLGLYLIQKDYGSAIANEIAKRLVISPKREGGQAQYAQQRLTDKPHHLSSSMQWAIKHLQKNITIDQMAERACLSRRSFDRHFRSRLGISPKEWLTQQRIGLAREYLESSSVSIELIAQQCGFGSSMNLRHHFSQVLGVSPSYYRRQFLQD